MNQFKRQTIPDGHFVKGSVVTSDFHIETHRNTDIIKSAKKTIVHATNMPKIELDLSWLPAAAESYHISPDIKDYILVQLPIVSVGIPNRNIQGFSLEELAYFCPLAGCLVYQTFNRKCAHVDHLNTDPTKAKGVIADVSMQYIPKYDLWKINAVTLWDRTKDSKLVNDILNKKRTGYSMGATVQYFLCSICGKVDNMDHTQCDHMKNKGGLYTVRGNNFPRLSYQVCSGTNFFEISSVADPADPTAVSEDIFI